MHGGRASSVTCNEIGARVLRQQYFIVIKNRDFAPGDGPQGSQLRGEELENGGGSVIFRRVLWAYTDRQFISKEMSPGGIEQAKHGWGQQ